MGKHKVKRPAIFLDRDGTLIAQRDDIIGSSQVKILKNVVQGLKRMQKLGFLCVVITNQPVIGKKLITKAGVERLNTMINGRLQKGGAYIDAFYVCPHRFFDNCSCRKPKLKLVREAVKKYGIDLKKSFFIGDDLRDIETGRRAKAGTILVKTGNAGKDKRFFSITPDFIARDLLAAAKIVEKQGFHD